MCDILVLFDVNVFFGKVFFLIFWYIVELGFWLGVVIDR